MISDQSIHLNFYQPVENQLLRYFTSGTNRKEFKTPFCFENSGPLEDDCALEVNKQLGELLQG